MTAPVIVVLPRGVHLADADSATAWCGADAAAGVRFTFQPGVDFGEARNDCPRCVAESKRRGLTS